MQSDYKLIRQVIEGLSMMNNKFMNLMLDDNVSAAQIMLRVILKDDKIKVKNVRIQRFIQNIYGQSTMGSLMIIGAVPLYNIYSVLVLTFEGDYPENERDTGRIKQAGINILKNPIIIGIVLGLIVALLHNPLPELVDSTVNNVAKMATPLALIGLGAGFEGKKALAKIKPTLWAAFIKLVAQAAIFIPIAAALGFRGEKMVALVVMLAAPATPSCYIMAKNMHNDGVLTASIVVATTLLASVTLTGWIFLLRTLGWI